MGSKCWVNIPTDVVYKLKGICAKHTLHNRKCDGCPLEEPCRYKSDQAKVTRKIAAFLKRVWRPSWPKSSERK